MGDLYKLKNLDEFLESLNYGMDIEMYIYEIRYNISWRDNKPFICTCPDGDAMVYNTIDDLMNNHLINGKPLIELWNDFKIISM